MTTKAKVDPGQIQAFLLVKRIRDDLDTPLPAIAAIGEETGKFTVWVEDPRRSGPVGVRDNAEWDVRRNDLKNAWKKELKRRRR